MKSITNQYTEIILSPPVLFIVILFYEKIKFFFVFSKLGGCLNSIKKTVRIPSFFPKFNCNNIILNSYYFTNRPVFFFCLANGVFHVKINRHSWFRRIYDKSYLFCISFLKNSSASHF